MIKLLSENLQNEMINENKSRSQMKNGKTQEKSFLFFLKSLSLIRNLMRENFNELAKSLSFYSLKKETQQKILSFEDLFMLNTKLHLQGTKKFFGNKLMSHFFKKQKLTDK